MNVRSIDGMDSPAHFGIKVPAKACCALANKLARIAYACLRDHAAYDEEKPNSRLTRKKTERLSFELPAGALAA